MPDSAGEAPYPFRFTCRRSGNCCARPDGRVRVDEGDVARIARHRDLSEDAFRRRFVRSDGEHLMDGLGSRCVFLDEGPPTRCSIYAVRPERCRTWPFWDENRNPRYLAEAARLCPGIVPDPGTP